MPALVLFRRKWFVAGDDLFFPFAFEAIVRTAVCITTGCVLSIQYRHEFLCNKPTFMLYVLVAFFSFLLANMVLCVLLAWISSRGSIMKFQERQLLSTFLYVKITSFLLDFTFLTIFVYIYSRENFCISPKTISFLQVIIVLLLLYFVVIIICTALAYDALGSAKYWNSLVEDEEYATKLYKKAKDVWTLRVKYLCCCFSGIGCSRSSTYRDIGSFLGVIFKNIDLVPTDILAGLLILSKKHASEKRRLKFMDSLCSQEYLALRDDSHPSWMTAENALYYFRLAKSSYGWMILCSCNQGIATKAMCCGLCSKSSTIQGNEGCCNCNVSGIQKSSGLADEDIIFVSYHTSVYNPAYFVVADKVKSCVTIAIRGTLSLSDILTDIDAECEELRLNKDNSTVRCHRGALRSAQNIYKKLRDLNILKIAFSSNPDYNLAIVGHSIGGSIAAILGLMLVEEYPKLQCFTYGPLAALCNRGTTLTQEFTITTVVGDDIAPALCSITCEDLRTEMTKSLQDCEIQKYKILCNAASKFLFNRRSFKSSNYPKSDNYFRENCVQHGERNTKSKYYQSCLFAPGHILYLNKTADGVKALWKTGFHFHRVIVCPRMYSDHMPRTIQHFLHEIIKQRKTKDGAANAAYCPSPVVRNKEYISSLNFTTV